MDSSWALNVQKDLQVTNDERKGERERVREREERELISPRDKLRCWLSKTEWSALNLYAYKQQKWIQTIVFMFVHTYKYTYLTIIIKGKEAVNLRVGGRYKRC